MPSFIFGSMGRRLDQASNKTIFGRVAIEQKLTRAGEQPILRRSAFRSLATEITRSKLSTYFVPAKSDCNPRIPRKVSLLGYNVYRMLYPATTSLMSNFRDCMEGDDTIDSRAHGQHR